MRIVQGAFVVALAVLFAHCNATDLGGCIDELATGPRPIASARDQRFEGKVQESTARCRGGEAALKFRGTPWVDWRNYYGTGDQTSLGKPTQNLRGVGGALIDLEYERIELIKFNLFDNSGTFEAYLAGRHGTDGPALKVWPEMRLPASDPNYAAVGGAGDQLCRGALIRGRTLTGICNDIRNPLMGSVNTLFARNVEFEETFPEDGLNDLTRNRHGDRLSLMRPDPQVISRKLFTRAQSDPGGLRRRLRQTGLLEGRELRLQESAVHERHRGLLDPVHDARLVLAPRRGAQRAGIHGRRLRLAEGQRRRNPADA